MYFFMKVCVAWIFNIDKIDDRILYLIVFLSWIELYGFEMTFLVELTLFLNCRNRKRKVISFIWSHLFTVLESQYYFISSVEHYFKTYIMFIEREWLY